jgi:glycosyltransferase involved in cell wall biosynthesis
VNNGVSICILTWNVFFYNRLAIDQIRKNTRMVNYEILVYDNGSTDGSRDWLEAQPDVTLFKGTGNCMRHGQALDFLTRRANYPICCALCSDAFPISPEWLTPAMYLDDEFYLTGIHRSHGRLSPYVCPSYSFGWTEWLKRHSFVDNWPKWDTGEMMGKECLADGHKLKTWPAKSFDFGSGVKAKICDYNGWVWHTWWSGRAQAVKGLAGTEFEKGYHDKVKLMLREKFGLSY